MLFTVVILTYMCSVNVLGDDDDGTISFPGFIGASPLCPNCPANSVCTQVSNVCDDSNCHKFPSCVDKNSQLCTPNFCSSGLECVNIVAPCLVPPCPSFPRCVPSSSPVRRPCRSDRDCSQTESCIKVVGRGCRSSSCRGRSLCVVTQGNNQEITCRTARCSAETPICINVLPKRCRRPPCKIRPKCIRPKGSVRRPCRSDRDCTSVEACLRVVDESCNSLNCPSRSVCVVTQGNNQEITCRNALCSPGSLGCVNVLPKTCPKPPCKINPKCLFPEGRRPCRSEADCTSVEGCLRVVEESCNSLNCPSRSVCVVTQGENQEITCRNVLCIPGSVGCVNVLPKTCPKPPCAINPKCLSPQGRTPCESDSECLKNQHCTDIVSEQCGQPSCPKRSVCVNNDEPTCERVPCPSGTVDCITIETNCPKPPCPVSPKCIRNGDVDPPPCGRNERCTAVNGKEGICTEVVNIDCNTPSCPRRADCIPLEFSSCRNIRCAIPGSVCVNKQPPCFAPPCPLQPTCLPPTPTSCGDTACKPGYFCADVQSCPEPSCQQFKTCVSISDPTCAATLCPVGTICVLIKPPCTRERCDPLRTQCVPNNGNGDNKPRLCPRLPHDPPGPQCNSDVNCKGNDKCCQLAGNPTKTCTPAVTGQTKPGNCPSSGVDVGICVFDPAKNCLRDPECPLDLKCCNAGCNSVCKKPEFYLGK